MPGEKFTKNADTPKRRRMWDDVYHDSLARGAADSSAIRMANAAVKKDKEKAAAPKPKPKPRDRQMVPLGRRAQNGSRKRG